MSPISKTNILVLALFALAVPGLAFATQQKFKLDDATVTLDVPETWQTVEDGFGMPLMVLGPHQDDKRPVIGVIPSGKVEGKFEFDAKKEDLAYKQGREEWLKSRSGRWLAAVPYTDFKSPGTSGGHSIGYRYEINGTKFVETSYYVTCKGSLYHLKSLMTSYQEADNAKAVEKMIGSFSCE